ncbi:hypothetical protein GW17_00054755 [Ensete ventricosum]|nr:hypothetical protein GW17_00054755 [Ensete ventricosum]
MVPAAGDCLYLRAVATTLGNPCLLVGMALVGECYPCEQATVHRVTTWPVGSLPVGVVPASVAPVGGHRFAHKRPTGTLGR